MKNTGIWLDKEKAHIITLDNDKEMFTTIDSQIEDFHVTSNKFIGGAQEAVKDRKYLEREKQQFKAYFKDIISNIEDADNIAIFGPAETHERFAKELNENYNTLSTKVKGVKKADSMTDNQVKAWVRNFFKSN